MPELEKVRQEYEPKGIGFLAVSIDQHMQRVQLAVAALKIRMTVAAAQSPLLTPYDIAYVPSTIFVDADGRVVRVSEGPRALSALRDSTEELARGLAKGRTLSH